jgi:Tfp pilus assembly protein PilF
MDSSFAAAHLSLGATLMAMERYSDARVELEEAVRRGTGAQAHMCLALVDARTGQADSAMSRIREARALTRNGADIPYDIAAVLGALGDRDAAFKHLDRAIAERYSGMVWLNVDPRMDSLRSDPRMPEYARRVGLPPVQRGS